MADRSPARPSTTISARSIVTPLSSGHGPKRSSSSGGASGVVVERVGSGRKNEEAPGRGGGGGTTDMIGWDGASAICNAREPSEIALTFSIRFSIGAALGSLRKF